MIEQRPPYLDVETTHRTKQGVDIPVEVRLSVWEDEARGPVIIAIARDVSAKIASRSHLNFLAYHDPLTALPNRILFTERLRHAMQLAKRTGKKVGVMFIDVDEFKQINDQHGHAVGDQLLRAVAERLSGLVRASDTVARLGGDEFTVVMEEVGSLREIEAVVEKVRQSFEQAFRIDALTLYVTLSIGVSVYPDNGEDLDAVINNADSAMYRAKRLGRNTYQLHDMAGSASTKERARLLADLRLAVERDEFELHFQPQFELANGALAGAEALARWRHPELGMLPPERFIPLAEEARLIVPLGQILLEQLARQARDWRTRGRAVPVLAVNVSEDQLNLGGRGQSLAADIERLQLHREAVEVEITERALKQDSGPLLRALHELRELGCAIAVDEYGSGSSSLGHLASLPIQKLKISRSFLQTMNGNHAVIQAIIALGRSLDCEVLGEGIEEEAQRAFLRAHGCRYGQGFLLGRPLPAAEFEALISR
ncbi:MAG: EAL domain-containing protein [Pseudomonadota bacterium]